MNDFLSELADFGLVPTKLVLFGSYAKNAVHPGSDIDLAMWADEFEGFALTDTLTFQSILSRFPLIQLRTYKTDQTANDDPFLEEVLKTGKELPITNIDVLF